MTRKQIQIAFILLGAGALLCVLMIVLDVLAANEAIETLRQNEDAPLTSVPLMTETIASSMGMLGLVVIAASGAIVACLAREEKPVQPKADPRVIDQLRLVQQAMDRMSQQAALSDDARRVLNRAKERELLNRAIEEDIRSQDWSAAQVLVNELAQRFGYEQDAERFRMRIERARAEGLDQEINESIQELDHLIVQRHWDEALAKADTIAARFPISPRVHGLRSRVTNARQQYKEEIERRFLLAAQAERVDEAMEILTELDHYLTEHEAEPFREVARGVIGKAKENLGAAFKLACQDRQWGIAISLGEQIQDQFPNSRMAQEVQGLLPQIRERAHEQPTH